MTGQTNIKFDHRKLEELVLCIAEKATDIGLTKLEKLLYLCDFISAEKTGLPITGETYRHFRRGPVPKHIVPILEGMFQKTLKKEKIPLADGSFIKITAKRSCDSGTFSSAEMQTIRAVMDEFGDKSSAELVAYVHHDLTYKATKLNDDIPYSLAIYRRYAKPSKAQAEELQADPDYERVLRSALQ